MTNLQSRKYYLYRYIRLDKNEPFYIGIGKKPKGFTNNYNEYKRAYSKQRNGFCLVIMNKCKYRIEIVCESIHHDYIVQKEIEFIRLYGRKDIGTGTLCNLTDGGEGCIGHVCSEKQKLNQSIKMKGRSLRQMCIDKYGTIKGIAVWNTSLEKSKARRAEAIEKFKPQVSGKNHWSTRVKVHPNKGRLRPPHIGLALSKANKRQRRSISTEFKSKPLIELDLNGNFVREWGGAKEASKYYKCSVGMITHVVKGRAKSFKGRKFEYKNNEVAKAYG